MISKVNEILEVGLDHAKKSKQIGIYCDLPEREVRHIIRDLIKTGVPVASSTDGKSGGYFIADTRGEAVSYMKGLRSRIIEDCLRLRDFKRASRSILCPEQLPLI